MNIMVGPSARAPATEVSHARPVRPKAIRSWIFLSFNILLQCFLLCLLNEEMHVFNPFGGRTPRARAGSAGWLAGPEEQEPGSGPGPEGDNPKEV